MAISLRTVALDTPSSAPRATVAEPTGCPVSTYSSISALRMAALRSSMALPPKSTDPGVPNGRSAGGMDSEEAGGGLVGQEPPGRDEDDPSAPALGQPVGHQAAGRGAVRNSLPG